MTMQRLIGRVDDDRGAVAIIVAVLSIAIIGIAAFATDRLAYSRTRQLQIASDGAALAAAKQFQDVATPRLTCATVLATGQTAADSVARSYALQNAPSGSTLASGVAPSGWSGDAGVAFRCNPQANIEVQVRTNNTSPAFFGQLFGASAYSLSRPATAAMGPATQVTGLRPFSFCKTVVDTLIAQDPNFTGQKAQVIAIDKVFNEQNPSGTSPTACGNASGNRETLGLDGSSNDPKNITLWTDVGYNKPIDLGGVTSITFPGDPGFPAANAGQCTVSDGCDRTVKTGDAFDDILGQPSVLPVFDVRRRREQLDLPCRGFSGRQDLRLAVGESDGIVPNPTFGGTACFDPLVPFPPGNGNASSLQIRLTNFIPVANLSVFVAWSALGHARPTLEPHN